MSSATAPGSAGPPLADGDGIVDSHVHLLPGRLAEKVRAVFLDGGVAESIFAHPLDHEVVTERLAADGVTTVWTLPYAHRAGVAAWLNEQAAVTAGRDLPVRVVGGCAVHPDDDDPVADLRRAVEDDGLRVLKLHCSVGDFTPTDARLEPVWDYVESISLPVVVHAGHSVAGTTEPDELAPVGEVARRHPAAPIVIAHCGHTSVVEALDLVRRHANIHADLTPVMTHPVELPADAAAELHRKLLFGTDAPNTGFTVAECLAHLDALGLSPDARAAITGANARRLVAAVRE